MTVLSLSDSICPEGSGAFLQGHLLPASACLVGFPGSWPSGFPETELWPSRSFLVASILIPRPGPELKNNLEQINCVVQNLPLQGTSQAFCPPGLPLSPCCGPHLGVLITTPHPLELSWPPCMASKSRGLAHQSVCPALDSDRELAYKIRSHGPQRAQPTEPGSVCNMLQWYNVKCSKQWRLIMHWQNYF